MDGLLGYPRQPIISRPPDAVQRVLPRLSQDSLHQLERNAKEPTAAHKASRVRNWVQDLSAAVNPILDATVKPYQNDLCGPTQGPTQSAGRSGQPSIHSNTAVPRYSVLGRVTMGHTTTPLPDSHAPVIDLTEPSNKRPRLFDYGRPSSQLQDKRVQPSYNSPISRTVSTPQPLNKSNSTSRFSQPASTPTLAAAKPSNPVNAKSSPQKNLFIDLSNDQKVKGPEKEDVFKTKIQDVFPDICEDYVKTLYAKHDIRNRTGQSFLVAIQDALDEILAKSPYPKHVSKKRKRDEGVDQDDLRRVRDDKAFYFPVAFKLLVKHYPSVPLTTVKDLLTRYKTFLKTYIALHSMGRPASDAHEYWRRLHSAKDKHPALFATVLEHELQEAKKTIAAKEGVLKKREEDAIEKLVEEEHRVAGTLVECQCCFTEVPPDRTVPCEGDEIHLFCSSCIKQKAEVQVGSMQYELKCFDTSGCQANFSSKLIRKVIGDKLMKRLEDLQQQDEIAKASIDGLEECPFCDFKAICPPVEQNKEFTCLNSDCEKVSCRLCKEETHIPQTCEEAKKKKERGIEVRHTVEEAMSAALIRKCPKCGLAIVKEDGCNKLKCRCGALICDVCKKDISKDGYMHFQVKSSTCNLHEGDTGIRRRMNEVMQAEKAAMAEVLAQGGKIDPEMLRVTSKEEASANQQAPAQRGMPVNVNRPRGQVPQLPQMPQIQMPQLPQMPQMPQIQMPQLPQMPRMQQMPQMPQFQMLNAAQIPQHRTPSSNTTTDIRYLCRITDHDICTVYGSTTSKNCTTTDTHCHYCINTHRDATTAVIQTSNATTDHTTTATAHKSHTDSTNPSATSATNISPTTTTTTATAA
ncbi:RING finger protein [Talaromyces pinophilus]|uniref:RING finger protein n=1 Tax=Talaromyces pinophilus TaxID=128442 RepID=A0A510NUV8_TALPI|nr:RING finger protein [Talaromyces pinophilus]